MNTTALKQLEKRLWAAADNLRANAGLKASQYATPILGLIFLKFADNKYAAVEAEVEEIFAQQSQRSKNKHSIESIAKAKCGFYLPPEARYAYLLNLPEGNGGDLAKAIKLAMEQVERFKPELEDVLPKDECAQLSEGNLLGQLLREFQDIPADLSGDLFGKIYEYFLGNFALAEGQGGGEFFTPESVVKLMVEVIEPHGGSVFDPACGSGGMFVQSANFIERHRGSEHPDVEVFGQEKE
ncbi:MAG: class I SAM-dependent DNA methyltransferase, partial [Gammaproteobacteria bacterium]|nr:class I SAM-dependent DNA methyltransferase [Gammaproteobacteria bacterium]